MKYFLLPFCLLTLAALAVAQTNPPANCWLWTQSNGVPVKIAVGCTNHIVNTNSVPH